MPEEFERESEDILNKTEGERVSADEARKNTEKAAADVNKEASEQNKRILDEALNKQSEVNSKLNRKVFETVADKEFTDAEWRQVSDFLNKMRDIPAIDYENPTQADVITLYDIYDQNKRISPGIADAATKAVTNLGETTTSNIINENTTSTEKNELKDLQDQVSTLSKILKELLENRDQSPQGINETTQAVKDLQNSVNNLEEKITQNEKLNEKLKSKGGVDYVKRFVYFAALGGLAFLGFYISGKMYADYMSGCYQYNGTNERKIPKPNDNNHPEWCSCGPPGNTQYQPITPDKFCPNQNQCPNNVLCNYPFCANGINPTEYPLCSDILGDKKPNEDGYIYYGYKIKTPFDLVGDLLNDAKKALEEFEKGIKEILMSVLKWGGIAIGVLLLLYIIYLIVNKTLASH